MGMFDTIVFEESPAKEGRHAGQTEFQTKELGRELDWYRVTKDGELVYDHPTDPDNLCSVKFLQTDSSLAGTSLVR